ELARVEEVGIIRKKIFEVLQTEVVREAEVEAPLVERQANREIGGIDEEETKRDERRQHEQHSLEALEGRPRSDAPALARRRCGDRSGKRLRAHSSGVKQNWRRPSPGAANGSSLELALDLILEGGQDALDVA